MERRALQVLLDYGLPFDQDKPMEGFAFDFAVPGLSLLVEVDGRRWHRHPSRKARDRAKEAVAKRNGWALVRLTTEDLEGRLRAAFDARAEEVEAEASRLARGSS